LPFRVTVPARGWVRVRYSVRSTLRGAFAFERIGLRLRSRLGLLERQVHIGDRSPVRVYPDFGALKGYALLPPTIDSRSSASCSGGGA